MAGHTENIVILSIVIALTKNIIETCHNLTLKDKNIVGSINETKTHMGQVSLRLDLIHAYISSSEGASLQTTQESGGAALESSLVRLEEILRRMDGRLSSRNSSTSDWTIQPARIHWWKSEVKTLNNQIERWGRHVQSVIVAWDMLRKVEIGSRFHKGMSKIQDKSMKAAVDLRNRVRWGTQVTSESLLSTLGLDKKLVEPKPRYLLPDETGKTSYYIEQKELAEGDWGKRQKSGWEKLSYVFKDSHLPRLNLLPCEGIAIVTHNVPKGAIKSSPKRFLALVYKLHRDCLRPGHSKSPTLWNALHADKTSQQLFISLEDRYRMATQIAIAVTEIHAAGLAHNAIESNNIIVDIRNSDTTKAPVYAFLIGFTTSSSPEMTPKIRQDIYKVGEVLIELGTQKTLDNLLKQSNPTTEDQRHKELLYHARHMGVKMGAKYSRAVSACLNVRDTKKIDKYALRIMFYEKVLLPLRQISEAFKVRLPISVYFNTYSLQNNLDLSHRKPVSTGKDHPRVPLGIMKHPCYNRYATICLAITPNYNLCRPTHPFFHHHTYATLYSCSVCELMLTGSF